MDELITICVRVTDDNLDEFEELLNDLDLRDIIVDWSEETCCEVG